ncbi:hypothetical protein [Crossiella equi]|uniref:hypothetical protein n=1 Tax=Crossiella equi TaxID=130796 RepID=UPI001B809814|nr:hypothetical protein [Crossiella equi]
MLFVPASPATERLPRLPCTQGSALGFGTGIVLTGVLAMLAADPLLALVLALVDVAVVSLLTTLPGALMIALQNWGLHVGFVTGHFGELRLDSYTEWVAALLAVVAVLASAVGAAGHAAPVLSGRAAPDRGRAGGPSPARS